jgi:nucleoside-diphosphate-sugar epimerase
MTSRVAAGPGSPTLAVPRVPRARAARARHLFSPRAQTGRVSDDAFPAIPPDASVLVIGASGRTGREVVRECLSRGIPVFAGTRDGAFDVAASLGEDVVAASVVPWTTPRVVPVRVDVTMPETIAGAFSLDHPERVLDEFSAFFVERKPTLVVFAATAPARGDPDAVDRRGLALVARACVENKVPRLVVISGAGVTSKNRDSPAYKFLNAFGGRMDAKARGEAETIDSFKESRRRFEENESPNDALISGCPSYTIVRPSGLLDKERRGVTSLAMNRGDVAAGFLSRGDLATCALACGFDARCAFASFEVYERGTAVPASTLSVAEILSDPKAARVASILTGQAFRENALFKSLFDASGAAAKQRDASTREATRFERTGFASWDDAFAEIERDAFVP